MKSLTALLLLLSISVQPDQTDLDNLKWMVGDWANVNNNEKRQSFESWTFDPEKGLVGSAFTVSEGDTTGTEEMTLTSRDGKLYFIANVSHNAGPVAFEIIESSKNHFISENKSHDFPKNVAYYLKDGQLQAEVYDDGQKIDFKFNRLK